MWWLSAWGLMSYVPELTAKEVIELVRRSGDRKDYPDNIYGYGVPDMWKAYQDYLLKR